MTQRPKRIILAISGASGAILGIRTLELLKQAGVETHLIISHAARRTITSETDRKVKDVEALASFCYDPGDIGARIASGSFVTDGMLVVPCSIKSLSGIANSYAENLVTRAADVCLKEGRKLILVVRETPLHPGHLRLLQFAASLADVLVVAVNRDGLQPGIVLPENLRIEGVRALSCVAYSFVLNDAVEHFIEVLKPDVVVKGKEHEQQFNCEAETVAAYGGELVFGSGEVQFSSLVTDSF